MYCLIAGMQSSTRGLPTRYNVHLYILSLYFIFHCVPTVVRRVPAYWPVCIFELAHSSLFMTLVAHEKELTTKVRFRHHSKFRIWTSSLFCFLSIPTRDGYRCTTTVSKERATPQCEFDRAQDKHK